MTESDKPKKKGKGRGGWRPGAGRPRTNTVQTTLTLKPEIFKALDELFRSLGVEITHAGARSRVQDGLRALASGELRVERVEPLEDDDS